MRNLLKPSRMNTPLESLCHVFAIEYRSMVKTSIVFNDLILSLKHFSDSSEGSNLSL